jgi:RHS repeat-associated protein
VLSKLRFALRASSARATVIRRAALVVGALLALLALPVVAGVAKRGHGHQQRGHRPPGLTKKELPRIPPSLLPRTRQSAPRSTAAQRRRSRTAHRGRAHSRALALLRSRFPQVAQIPHGATPKLPAGARVERYLGKYAERIALPKTGRRQVVVSPLPVRARTSRGRSSRVSLGLNKEGGAYEPANPLVDLALPEQLGDGVAIGDDGVRIKPASSQAAGATVTVDSDQAFYPNTATDQDTLVTPSPTGVELFTQLRSPDAPEAQVLEFDLPAGAELRATDDGGAEVMRGDERLVRIFKPAAADADGRPVPTSYSVDGNRLTVHAEHRGGDYAYPILVDPLLEDWGSRSGWADSWFYNPGSDTSGWFFADSPQNSLFATIWGFFTPVSYGSGYGLYALAPPETFLPAGSYGEWLWRAPGQTTFIPRADFGLMYRDTQADTKNQSVLVDGIYSESQHRFTGYHQFNGRVMGQSDVVLPGANMPGANPRAGNLALFALAFPYDHKRKTWTTGYLGGAGIYLDDPEAPTITGVQKVPDSGWIDPSTAYARVSAHDPGLGVSGVQVTTQTSTGGTSTSESSLNCGNRFYECQADATADVSYAGRGLPNGVSTVSVRAKDPLGHVSAPSTWQIKVDRADPTLALSGSLHDVEERFIDGTKSYSLHIDARDGDATNPSSGVASLELTVDGVRKLYATQECAAGNCSLQRDFTLDSTQLSEGGHAFSVVAIDQAGRRVEHSWTTRIDRTDPNLDVSGSLTDHQGHWLDPSTSYTLSAHAFDGYWWQSPSGVRSVEFQVDGVRRDYAEQTCEVCPLDHTFTFNPADYADGTHTVTVVATDAVGHTATKTTTAKVDRTPPQLSLSGALKDAEGHQLTHDSYALAVDALDPASGVKSAEVQVDGERQDYAEQACPTGGCPLFRDFVLETSDFSPGDHTIHVVVTDQLGARAESQWAVTIPASTAADPEHAPPLDMSRATTVYDATRFLYSGSDPLQTGVASATIRPAEAGVVRGKVTTRDGTPLPGVSVSVVGHPEFGVTHSTSDGDVFLAVNGNETVRLRYSKPGYIEAERQTDVPWQHYAWVDDVALVALDDHATHVDLGSPLSPPQVARGSEITDGDGTRRASLIFDAGTQASMRLADGSTRPLSDLTVRATEFTVGSSGEHAMPAELPQTSGYTYAVDYSVDEARAAGATEVDFTRPVATYEENFLHFPVGSPVPAGYYDKQLGSWVASKSGRVIKILSEADGAAVLDVAGHGQPADAATLASLGITTTERQKLAELYDPGQELWRVAVAHFSAWDKNWGISPPAGAGGPGGGTGPFPIGGGPFGAGGGAGGGGTGSGGSGGPGGGGGGGGGGPCPTGGSVIQCETRSLGEDVDVSGVGTLHYESERTPGRKTGDTIDFNLSADTLPGPVKRIEVEAEVAGRRLTDQVAAAPNARYRFSWDGKDAFGRTVQGTQPLTFRIGYVYDGDYASTQTFAEPTDGTHLDGDRARAEFTFWRDYDVNVGSWDARAAGLGGWTFAFHHTYDPVSQTVYLGDGRRISARDAATTITRVAGVPNQPFAEGSNATSTGLFSPDEPVFGPDGTMYFSEFHKDQIRKVAPDGTTAVIAGGNGRAFSGDGGPASAAQLAGPRGLAIGPDGSLYVADTLNHRVRRIDGNGKITTVVGNGVSCGNPDGPALQVPLCNPADVEFADDGTMYVADWEGIRRIDTSGNATRVGPDQWRMSALSVGPDGSVYYGGDDRCVLRRWDPRTRAASTVAGNGTCGFSGDGGKATASAIGNVHDVYVAPDGTIYLTAGDRLRCISAQGIISTLSGSGASTTTGDNGPAGAATMNGPSGIGAGPDGAIYVSEAGGHVVRRVGSALRGFSGARVDIPSPDGEEVYEFDSRGRHLRTVNALTGATRYSFAYDDAGHLASVMDGDGNITRVLRDAAGTATAIVDPDGRRTDLHVNADGFLDSLTSPAQAQTRFAYTADGLMQTLTDPRDHVTHFTHDDQGRLITDEDPLGGFKNFSTEESQDGATVTMQTKLGQTSKYLFDQLPDRTQRRRVTRPDGVSQELRVAPDGSRHLSGPAGTRDRTTSGDSQFGASLQIPAAGSITTPSGRRLDAQYANQATLGRADNPLSMKTLGETLTVNGRSWQRLFDAGTRTRTLTTPMGRRSAVTIDAQGRPLSESVPGTATRAYTYDARGRVTRIQQAGRSWDYGYGSDGQLASITDPVGRATQFTRDAAGRVTEQILPGGRRVAYGYDANGNVTSVTPPGRGAYGFEADARDLPATATAPDAGDGAARTTYRYDDDRRLTSIQRPDGTETTLAYDPAGHLATATEPRGVTRFTYDASSGTMASAETPSGAKLVFGYDGALLREQVFSGAIAGRTSRTYDNDLRVASSTVDGTPAIGFGYDADGLLTSAGSLSIQRDPASGATTGTTLGGVTTSTTYDSVGAPATSVVLASGADVLRESLTRDKLGRITDRTESAPDHTSTFHYDYDAAGRLTDVSRDGAQDAHYDYDSNGNRTSVTRRGELPLAATYDAQDRLRSFGSVSYDYDANGDLARRSDSSSGRVTTYRHDGLGRLDRVGLPDGRVVDYGIDAAGRRVSKRIDGALAGGFLYDTGPSPVAEIGPSGDVVSRFVYGTSHDVPDYMTKGGHTYRLVRDALGNVRLVVDTADGHTTQAIDYDPLGRVTRDTNPGFQPFGFAGGLRDVDTGLVHFGAREYDPEAGRWIENDPIGFAGGDSNAYDYVLGDPVNLTDASGLITGGVCVGGSIGFIITAHVEGCVEVSGHGEIGVGHKEGIGIGGIAPPGVAPSANVSNADHLTDQNGPFTEVRTGRGASVSVGDAPCGDGKVVNLSVGPGDVGAPSIGVSDSSINPIGR